MLLPKQHLRRPEPRNSSELRGECRRCLSIRCRFYLESLGKRPAARKGHRSFPGRGRSRDSHRRPPPTGDLPSKSLLPILQWSRPHALFEVLYIDIYIFIPRHIRDPAYRIVCFFQKTFGFIDTAALQVLIW